MADSAYNNPSDYIGHHLSNNTYALSDRASWGAHANKADFKIMVEGDQRLFNPYGVMLVDSQKCPNVRSKEGQIFIDWLISAKGQAAIASFKLDGKQLFFPNAE